jgi:membrane-associated protease RseP (regulator of RpoE activity)
MLPFTLIQNDVAARLRAELSDIMAVSNVLVTERDGQQIVFAGRLLCDAQSALERLLPRFERHDYTPLLRRQGDQDLLIAQAGVVRPERANPWINLVLLLATIASTVLWGALNEGADPLADPFSIVRGIPFSLTLMSILGAHELGHYFMARRRGVAVTLPYFIPMPLPIGGVNIGTMGAFIQFRSLVHNRRELLDVGLAGPVAGLVVAIPLLIHGLAQSPVKPVVSSPGYFTEGNSILYLALKYLVHGRILPGGGLDVFISSIAFAGWIGILVTSLNLMPAGQLDGGHIVYALLGDRARLVAMATLLVLAALSFLWIGWLIWIVLIFFFGLGHPPPLDDITELDPKRKVIGVLAVIMFILVFTPVPFSLP